MSWSEPEAECADHIPPPAGWRCTRLIPAALTASRRPTCSGFCPTSRRAGGEQEAEAACWCSHRGKKAERRAASGRRERRNHCVAVHNSVCSDTQMFWKWSRPCCPTLTRLPGPVSPSVPSLPAWSPWPPSWSTGETPEIQTSWSVRNRGRRARRRAFRGVRAEVFNTKSNIDLLTSARSARGATRVRQRLRPAAFL